MRLVRLWLSKDVPIAIGFILNLLFNNKIHDDMIYTCAIQTTRTIALERIGGAEILQER